MAGINSAQVYLPSPDQTASVGAVFVGAIGSTAPTDARTALDGTFTSGGYISESGVSLNVSRSTESIKDWSLATVRKAITDFDGTLSFEFLQIDQFAATEILGAANIATAAATQTSGSALTMKIGPQLPTAKAWAFNMKDGERRIRIYVPNGQITEIPSDVTFVPNAANIWPVTLSCYDDGTGHSIYVFYDDGQKVSG